jgi:hypothetical protein
LKIYFERASMYSLSKSNKKEYNCNVGVIQIRYELEIIVEEILLSQKQGGDFAYRKPL